MGFKLFRNQSVAVDTNHKTSRRSSRTIHSLFRDKPSTPKGLTKVLGGAYISKKNSSLRSFDTDDQTETQESWKSCGSQDYCQRSKLSSQEKQKLWVKGAYDCQRVPSQSRFSSNHIMVNKERAKRLIPTLKRSPELDSIARWHAETLAVEGAVRHSNARELQSKLQEDGTFKYLGENVAVGESIKAMHLEMLDTLGDLRNMCDSRYNEFGMATALSHSGELYMCQIYRG